MNPQEVRISTWLSVDEKCSIEAVANEDRVTLELGGRHDSVEIEFQKTAVDRLIEAAIEGRKRMLSRRPTD